MRRIVALVRKAAARIRHALSIRPAANELEAAVQRDQCNLLFLLCLLFSATGGLNVVVNSFAFGVTGEPFMMVMVGAVVLHYAAIIRIAVRWKRDKNDFQFLRQAQWLYGGLGLCWGTTIILFALNGRPDQAVLLLGLASGVVSTPIISVPLGIAFAFFIPDAILSIYAVSVAMPNANLYSAMAFISFTAYAATGIIFTNFTFSGRSEARAALQREIATVNVFLREYEEGSPDWLWQTDQHGRVSKASARMGEAAGLTPAEMEGMPMAQLLSTVRRGNQPDDRFQYDLAMCFQERQAFRELLVRHDGSKGTRWFRLTGHPVFSAGGSLAGFRGIGRDVTSGYEASEKVNFLARHDTLTGLLNRRSFVEAIETLCEEKRSFAIALIDLDSFKKTNDTFGHHIGDRLLQVVAGRIQQSMRPQDFAARLGGDEFATIIVGADNEEGRAVADRLAERLNDRVEIDGMTIVSGASIGVSACPQDAQDPQRLLLLADLALYKAKDQGKGKAFVFDRWIEEEHHQQISREAELREAIDKGQISLVYQPIVDLMSSQIVSAEALVRWNHPVRGCVEPGEFIETAERANLMEELGKLVLQIACRDAALWPDPIQVNVNLSPRQLRSGQFPQILADTLAASGLSAERLAIEITENVLLDQDDKTLQQLDTIRGMGVGLILDDFGTGYSSLTYLHKVEVRGIKIDASFTRQLPERKVAAIYRMIARLAMDLNIYVVAEGVEDASQVEWLNRNGIRFAQGYLLGRPMPSPPTSRVEYLA
ncbi:putative bifunctional diguanylate cyclase/phosphodiesterase [Pseudoroseomonas globiformis]|uniref:Bifunctional diguanylate cyclase/phosphodiesterase n=1 Tax=Teichococcus globiformis TaxID=2307229 RepID=A0ABV7G073_9PROT